MKITPLLNRVVIMQDSAVDQTKSGLLFPDTSKEKPLSGKVVANGEKCLYVKEGDNILYNKYRGTEIVLNGVDHVIMTEDDILAII
jgi:chaperonin GroES